MTSDSTARASTAHRRASSSHSSAATVRSGAAAPAAASMPCGYRLGRMSSAACTRPTRSSWAWYWHEVRASRSRRCVRRRPPRRAPASARRSACCSSLAVSSSRSRSTRSSASVARSSTTSSLAPKRRGLGWLSPSHEPVACHRAALPSSCSRQRASALLHTKGPRAPRGGQFSCSASSSAPQYASSASSVSVALRPARAARAAARQLVHWRAQRAARSAATPPARAYSRSPMSRSSERAARERGKKAAASSRMERRRSLESESSTATGPSGGLYLSARTSGRSDGASTCDRHHRAAASAGFIYPLENRVGGVGVGGKGEVCVGGDQLRTASAAGERAIRSSRSRDSLSPGPSKAGLSVLCGSASSLSSHERNGDSSAASGRVSHWSARRASLRTPETPRGPPSSSSSSRGGRGGCRRRAPTPIRPRRPQ
eukprot:scaffold89637_cov27-Tisochrysis_lutea.AAC.4